MNNPTVIESGADSALLRNIQDILSEHSYLNNRYFDLKVRGRVVHVRGVVASREDQFILRKVLSRIKGVLAVWDIVTVLNQPDPIVVDIGCGGRKQVSEAVGVDRYLRPGVDLVADVEDGLPFPENHADHLFAVHILEHVSNLIGVMNEIHRVLKPDGMVHVLVPNSRCSNAVADPTHVRFFNKKTFRFFCQPYPGLLPFRPVNVSSDRNTIFADLTPVIDRNELLGTEELEYFFE